MLANITGGILDARKAGLPRPKATLVVVKNRQLMKQCKSAETHDASLTEIAQGTRKLGSIAALTAFEWRGSTHRPRLHMMNWQGEPARTMSCMSLAQTNC